MKNFSTFVRLKKLTPKRFLQLVANRKIKLQSPGSHIIQKTYNKVATLHEEEHDPKDSHFYFVLF